MVFELSSAARVLDSQIGERRQISTEARALWEGSYAQQFDAKINTCITDAQRLTTSMQTAATQLEELAMLARQEQLRRELAREWNAQAAAYVAAGLPPPPPPPSITTPIEPPNILIDCSPPMSRSPSMPAGGELTDRSSADPDHLDRWVNASRELNAALSARQATSEELQANFSATSRWGIFDASALIGAFRTYIGYNENDAQWTSTISGTFRHADSSSGVRSLPDPAIAKGLKAGLTGTGMPPPKPDNQTLENLLSPMKRAMTQPPLGGDPSDPLIEHYKLPPEVNEEIFREQIIPTELAHVSPRERPEAVILVGQPGAGKTRLGEQLARDLDERGGFVDVDSDLYKPYHPGYEHIMNENDQKMAVYTRHDGRVWMAKVQDDVRERKLNAIVQETIQNPEYFVQTVQAYRAAGFKIRVAVMGVPEGLSRQGILGRYYQQIAHSGHGRLTVSESAALSYRGILDGVKRIDELGLADEVEVYRRGELEPRYHDELTDDGTWRSGTGGLRDALEQERSRPLTPDEIGEFRESQQRLREVAGVEHQDELSRIDNLVEPLIQPSERPQ